LPCSSPATTLSEALEQIDEQVYEPHEQVEDDLEDLHDDVGRVVGSARIRITAIISNNLPTSTHPPPFTQYMTTATNQRCEMRLARAGPGHDTVAMTEEEIRERVKEILLKQSLGEALTSQEETILAYAHYAAGEQAVRIWVQPDIEAAE
jgi:hypothetical protein